ncbi:MAG: TetR/AcrR family transcriptional regulator [Actinomycetia bacterium]|nr:TetR/AcrR family transcriptional regulator [Actinomycetes bacterium]
MRYSVEHKAQSQERILDAARELFRARGFDGASIDQVMAAAGLTRGAFYAHFDSKADLVRQVLAIEAGLVHTLRRTTEAKDPQAAALATLTDYLDPSQRANNATGCPLVAHPVDAIRGDADRGNGYTEQLKALIASVDAIIDGDDTSQDAAILVSVLTVGGALLSAASTDRHLADGIEAVCLDRIAAIVGHPVGG